MEGVPQLQTHSFGCLSNVTKRYWRHSSVTFQKKAWKDSSKLKLSPGSVPDCSVTLNADPEELLHTLQHLQKRDSNGAVQCHCQQHVQWDSQTSLLAETSVSVRRGGWEKQWVCEWWLHYLDASVSLCYVQESLPARQTGAALCRWFASRELHLPDFLQYPSRFPETGRVRVRWKWIRFVWSTGKETMWNSPESVEPSGICAIAWLTGAFVLLHLPPHTQQWELCWLKHSFCQQELCQHDHTFFFFLSW